MWKRLWVAGAALGSLTIVSATSAPTVHPRQTSNVSTISWFACPDLDSTECAFFSVPMDYTNPSSNSTVSIFMRKYPATAPADQRLGSILINTGGPGRSGSDSIALWGSNFSTMVDGRYDIIGFDPRGVNLTGPSIACLDTEYKYAQRLYQLNLHGAPFPHVGGEAELAHVAKFAAIQSTDRAACVENGNHEMLKNLGTVSVAKDMERIVEVLGEDGLNYLGYSYGTILGATFAAIRPNLVKRMVLNGVSDAEAYFNDILQWGRGGMQGTNKTLKGFISTCIEAGPTQCALAATKDNKTETAEGLTKRLDDLYIRLGKEPLVVGDSATGPGIVQAAAVQGTVFSMLITPQAWPQLAQILATLEQGDGREYYPTLNNWIYGAVPKPYNQNVFDRSMQTRAEFVESEYPILCSDSAPLNITTEEYVEYFREMGRLNSVGEQYALITGWCNKWPFRASERYTGPWTAEKGLNKTRFPILFISLDQDPITPLASGVKMSNGFGSESATLLIQEGFGHTSLAQPSLCIDKNVRDYFIDGKVPKNGTHCASDPGLIYPANSAQSIGSILSRGTNNY